MGMGVTRGKAKRWLVVDRWMCEGRGPTGEPVFPLGKEC